LKAVIAALRDPQSGCPWDIAQTHASLTRYALEEAYEVVDAIEHGSMADLRDELGDLLLQVVLHARIAEEAGHFVLEDVVQGLTRKMVRRHPHVFSDRRYDSIEEQKADWEAIKQQERGQTAENNMPPRVLAGVAHAQPALQRAHQLQKRAASVGFDWDDLSPVFSKIEEEVAEIRDALAQQEPEHRIREEVGDLLFATVNLARHLGVNAEEALRKGNHKFEARFASVEDAAQMQGRDLTVCSLEEMEQWWQAAKLQDKAV
ncbi:unnamed protein product, partial [Cyprideis torosa]